ncbi:uncharacterized protein [Haliotis cracherodii]|uniref:uncharacterized protein n=1 Tax=Haliotis cracherodii TaxID=6455 RepID=UPI0039E79F7B
MKVFCICISLFGVAVYAQAPPSVHPTLNIQTYPTTNTYSYPMSNNYAYQGNNGNIMSSYSGYNSNAASTQNGYQSNNNINSYMLPMMMGMDQGRHMATLGLMMNSKQGNNMLPFYMMNQGYENMLPMMAFMNSGNQRGQRMNPFMMMTLHEAMN